MLRTTTNTHISRQMVMTNNCLLVSLLIVLLLVQSSLSFAPQQRSLQALSSRLFYSYVAEDIALDTQHNVELFDSTLSSLNKAWKSLIPLVPGERGCDVAVTWSSPEQGAALLVQDLFPTCRQATRDELETSLVESFQQFASLFDKKHKFKARIVATRGPSGTKCPRWHVDHVSKRWIQSLVGPGCDYIEGSDGIQWELVNGLDSVDDEANLELVNEKVATIRHSPQGQGVVLHGAENVDGRFPAVHKSPSLGPFQGRVLLTIDVVRE